MVTRKHPSAPSYQTLSARKGRQAKANIPLAMRTPADLARENQKKAFKCGLMLGFSAAALAFALLLWAWVIPTMDGAVEQARQAASYGAVAL